jgi:hypothetical protein
VRDETMYDAVPAGGGLYKDSCPTALFLFENISKYLLSRFPHYHIIQIAFPNVGREPLLLGLRSSTFTGKYAGDAGVVKQ